VLKVKARLKLDPVRIRGSEELSDSLFCSHENLKKDAFDWLLGNSDTLVYLWKDSGL
jgi:hypothetical protein